MADSAPIPEGSVTTPDADLRTDEAEDQVRKRLFISGSALLAVPILSVYAYLEITNGYLLTGLGMISFTLLVLVNAFLARNPVLSPPTTRVMIASACCLIVWELFHHGAPGTLLFTPVIPLGSVFVFGRREGLFWSLVMWLGLTVVIANASALNLPALNGLMTDFTAAYAIVLLLTLGYETLQAMATEAAAHHVSQLRNEQQRLQDFASVASDWMYELDADLRFTSISEKWSKSLQLRQGSLVGVPITSISRNLWQPNEELNTTFAATLMGRKPYHDIRFSIALHDEVIHLTTNGQPIFDESGTFAGYRGTAKDISDIVNSQELIREKEAELMQAQKMEAIGQLTSGVAHDFNNLLTVINGNLELMKLNLEDSGVDVSKIDSAMMASDRAAELTNKLLAFARRQPLNPETVDIAALIGGLEDMFSRTLGEQIAISLTTAPELWVCHVDVGLLENAILNLAINARDAMDDGGELTISCSNLTIDAGNRIPGLEPGDYVKISVSDTGRGIPPEQLPHVFEPFFTTKPQGEGSGLGLSMVYGFASQSGGHADIVSELDRGTSANVYLPRYTGTATAPRESASAAAVLDRRKILVIEDEGDVRELVGAMTRTLGHDVRVAANGEEARRILEEWQPDILLSDVVLGAGETGPKLAAEAQALNDQIKVLLMSGYPEFALEGDGRLDTSWRLLKKPFGREQLRQSLQLLYQ